MLKQLLFCFAFAAVGTVPAIAEQQAVVLRKVELPGAGFDIVFAASKGHTAVTISRPDAKDPLIISPIGSEFAHAVQGEIGAYSKTSASRSSQFMPFDLNCRLAALQTPSTSISSRSSGHPCNNATESEISLSTARKI